MISKTKRQTTLNELISEQASKLADKTFLKLNDEQWSYADIDRQAHALAAGLQGLGMQPGDRLALLLPNVPPFVIALFASAKAGLIFVPINIRRHPSEVFARLNRSLPKAIITFSDPDQFDGTDYLNIVNNIRDELPEIRYVVSLKHPSNQTVDQGAGNKVILWDELVASSTHFDAVQSSPADPAAIVHTLGSSGDPRGAVLTHGGLTRNAAGIAANLVCTPEDVFLGAVPFSNTFGLTATVLACAVSGAEIVCLPRYSPGKALALIRRERITIHHGVPTMFAMELHHPSFKTGDCANLRTGIMSGAPCPPDLVKRVRRETGCNLILAYGLTEASPSVTMTQLSDGPVTASETVGRPMEGVELKVIDPDGNSLPDGEVGELCVRGYNVMLGYWNDPQATSKVLDSDGWLHTSDLACIDPDGPVRIEGRQYNVIMRGGFKVYPGTIEMVIRSFPGVKEAAVVGVPDMIYGELMCACVVPSANSVLHKQEILAYAAERLADYALPDRVLIFSALPRGRSGLVDKAYLRERVRIRGRTWKFGKNVDTDAIIPARRCNTADPAELAQFCMEDADPDFVRKMTRGDLIVAESNFGCGSSREVAPLSIKAAGVSAVIAKSFARIFFRNAINIGLPILECAEAVDGIQEGDEVEVEPVTGIIRNVTRGETYHAEPFPDFLQQIIDQGGLLAYVEQRLNEKGMVDSK